MFKVAGKLTPYVSEELSGRIQEELEAQGAHNAPFSWVLEVPSKNVAE